MGEVEEITGVPAYTLRYWEKNFNCISPNRSGPGSQRRFRLRDVELFLRIKELVQTQKFSLDGAKRKLQQDLQAEKIIKDPPPSAEQIARHEVSRQQQLIAARNIVLEILDLVHQ